MTHTNRRRFLSQTLALPLASGLGSVTNSAFAQGTAWPSRPINLIVPAPPGGGVDASARKMAELLGPILGTSVVVQNRPGAAGLIGALQLAQAPADGLTVGYLHSGHIVLQVMEGKPNMQKDFTALTKFSASQFAVAVSADSPYKTLADLLSAIEKNPGKLTWGAGGVGSPGFIAFEKLLRSRPRMSATHILYKGAIEAGLAVVAKDIDFTCGVFSTVLPLARSGRVRVLAVTGGARSSQLPDVPTVAEAAKLPNYRHESWGALFAPAKLPPELVKKWDQAMRQVANDANFKKFITETGGEPALSASPEALTEEIRKELIETQATLSRIGLIKK